MWKAAVAAVLAGVRDFVTLSTGWYVPKGKILVELPGGERKLVTMQTFSQPISGLFLPEDGQDNPVFVRLLRHFRHPARAVGSVAQLKWEALMMGGATEADLAVLELKLKRVKLCLGVVLIKPTNEEIIREVERQLDDVRGQSYGGSSKSAS